VVKVMDRITHVLVVLQHAWKWIFAGGLATLLTAFWEPLMKALKSFYEAQEARYKSRKAKAEAHLVEIAAPNAEHEAKIQDAMGRFRKHFNDAETRFPGQHVVPDIQPSPGDDLDVHNEALRRIKQEYAKPTGRRSLLLA
jgi:hypothetical protein